MKPFFAALIILLAFSCSKQESSTQASEAADTLQAAPTTLSDVQKEISLTEAEREKVAWAVFLSLHAGNVYDGPDVMVYKEEFSVEGNYVTYKLLRYNSNFG